jgi:spore coat-associated protein N
MRNLTVKTKLIATIAALAAASVAAIGGTYANFTATPVTIGSNAFTTGTLTMSRSGSGAIFSAAGMKIGDTATGSVTITNTGSLQGHYTLTGSSAGNVALAGQLKLKIYKDVDNSGTALYDDTLSGFSSVDLGTWNTSSEAHTFYFHVSLPSAGSDTADNLVQGLTTTETFTWSATQA